MKNKYNSNFLLIYIISFLFNTYFISAILVPFYLNWGGIRFSQVLFINAAFMFFVFILEVPTGTVADYLGRKASMLFAAVFSAAGVLIYVSYPSFYIFLTAEFVFAIGFTLISGANDAIIYDSLKETGMEKDSKVVFARKESAAMAAIMTSAAAGGFIAKYLGLRAPFLFMTVPFMISIIFILLIHEPPFKRKNRSFKDTLTYGVKQFSGHPTLKILAFDMVMVGALSWLIIFFYQKILMQLGMDIRYFGIVHASMCAVEIIVMQNFLNIENLLRSKRGLLIASGVIPGISFIALGFTNSLIIAIIAILLAAGFGLTRIPLFVSYMNKYIESSERATVLSVANMFRTLGICVVNTVAGLASEWSPNMTIIVSGILLLTVPFISKIREGHLRD